MSHDVIQIIETHPFEIFIPRDIEYLIIGSFPGKGQTETDPNEDDWFYGSKRNTFWKILELVYDMPLKNKKAKQDLFIKTKIGIGDIILKAKRKEGTNSDSNLEIIEFNTTAIKKVLEDYEITTVFFTSKFVEKLFRKFFPHLSNRIILPSPSPRSARVSLIEKVAIYKKYLPGIN